MIFMPMRSGLAIAVTVLLSLACGTSQDPSFVDAERSPSYKIAVTVGEEDATAQGADGYQGSASRYSSNISIKDYTPSDLESLFSSNGTADIFANVPVTREMARIQVHLDQMPN